jgi:hypothetical protein
MAYTQMTPRFTPSARVQEISRDASHYRLTIPAGEADSYRLAQLDDYSALPRWKFPHQSEQAPSLTLRTSLSLLARTSSDSIPGTWGFGLWNDPFGLSLGFGGRPWRLPVLPNAVWFFGASEENYLSFGGLNTGRWLSSPEGAYRNSAPTRPPPANGFLAQTFRSPRFHPLLIPAGLALPFSRKLTRRLLGQVIAEDGVSLSSRRSPTPTDAQESTSYAETACGLAESKGMDPTDWHRYRLEWNPKRVLFEVDDVQVFESAVSPNPPLGLVIWIDNQYAAFTPEGKIGFGVLENPEPAWLEIRNLEIEKR